MNKIDELEEMYNQQTGNNFSFLTNNGIVKTEASSLMLIYDNCNYDIVSSIKFFINEYYNIPLKYDLLNEPLTEFYTHYESVCFDKSKIDYIRLGSEIYMSEYRTKPEFLYINTAILPKCKKKNTGFLDLASGFNFLLFFPYIDIDTQYYLVDKSIFTSQCLLYQIEQSHLNNVEIINKDIIDIYKNDFNKEIEIIRAKNIFRYIQDFKKDIQKFKDILATNGLFYFQEQSSEKIPFQTNSPYSDLDQYFADGWKKQINIIFDDKPNSLDSVYYEKIIA